MKEKAKKYRKVETDEDGLEIGTFVIVIQSYGLIRYDTAEIAIKNRGLYTELSPLSLLR